jgi:hypothetical protein
MAFKKMFFTTKKRRGRRNKEKSSFSSSLRGFIFLESYTSLSHDSCRSHARENRYKSSPEESKFCAQEVSPNSHLQKPRELFFRADGFSVAWSARLPFLMERERAFQAWLW